MAQNITLMGASYADVPSVLLPKTGGGMAQFDDTTTANATAAQILSGYTAWVNGALLTGTASGGGGGLECESGIYNPSADIARPTISFSQTHTDVPIFVGMSDATGTLDTTSDTNQLFVYFDSWGAFGEGYPYSGSAYRYATVLAAYRGTSAYSINTSIRMLSNKSSSTIDTGNTYPRYYVTPSNFKPYADSTSRYWRAGRTYKWIAVWKP